jgi:cytosine/adenosine deaminase-related metal-dependent hydrolase
MYTTGGANATGELAKKGTLEKGKFADFVIIKENPLEIMEVNIELDEIQETESFHIKKRNDVYYKIYLEAKQKAKLAKDLALSAYLEMKRIKNTYMLQDSEDDEEEEA